MDCNYQAVPAQVHKEEVIPDAFIEEIISNKIGQRFLEDNSISEPFLKKLVL